VRTLHKFILGAPVSQRSQDSVLVLQRGPFTVDRFADNAQSAFQSRKVALKSRGALSQITTATGIAEGLLSIQTIAGAFAPARGLANICNRVDGQNIYATTCADEAYLYTLQKMHSFR